MELPELLTEKEAAAIFKIGVSTLQRKRLEGEIRFVRIDGKNVRYRHEHLTEYLEKRERNTEDE